MATRKQRQAARRNGKLSRGPVTPEGKKRSSQNSLTHGLYSRDVVLTTESLGKFNDFKQDYLDTYQPATRDELDLVEEIVMCRWRLIRHWTAEAASLDLEMQELEPKMKKACESYTPAAHLAVAYRASEKSIANFRRIEASLSRQALQADKRLRELIELRLASEPPASIAVQPQTPASPAQPYPNRMASIDRNDPPVAQVSSNQQPPENSPAPLAPAA